MKVHLYDRDPVTLPDGLNQEQILAILRDVLNIPEGITLEWLSSNEVRVARPLRATEKGIFRG